MALEDAFLPLYEDDRPVTPIQALPLSLHTPDLYLVPSIPQRSSTPASVSTIILESTSEPVLPKPNTAKVEVVDLAEPTYGSGGKGSGSNLELYICNPDIQCGKMCQELLELMAQGDENALELSGAVESLRS